MMMEGIRRSIYGLAYGGFVTFLALTVLLIIDYTPSIQVIWQNSFAAMILGLYFGLASFIFETDRWSPLKRTIFHYLLSISVYYLVAFICAWIPLSFMPILISTLIFTFIYMIFWVGYRVYYKKVELSLNESLKQKE